MIASARSRRAAGPVARPAAFLRLCIALLAFAHVAGRATAQCPTFSSAADYGAVQDSALIEISGLAASRANPGVLWAHNDSGDTARVFALGYNGARLGEFAFSGAAAVDWEDMSLGPGPLAGQDYLYMADIGANAATRPNVVIYRAAEPAVNATAPPTTGTLTGIDAITLTYPDALSHDAEAMFVDPVTGDIFIIAKIIAATAKVYRKPAPHATGSSVLQEVATAPVGAPLVTGADIAQDGSEIIVRTYGSVKHWDRAPGQTVAQALGAVPCDMPKATEPQGEAIAFAPKACGYFTVSEGVSPMIHFFARPGFCAAGEAWMRLE